MDIIDKILNTPAKPVEYADLSDNILLNPENFQEKLSNIDSLSESEVSELVRKTYNVLLDEIDKKQYNGLSLFTNVKFLTAFLQVIRAVRLTESQRRTINKLCYDYLTWTHEKNNIVKNLLFNMSKVVNQDVLPGLLGLGLNEELADFLALSRFSSSKELINVKRVNFIIRTQPSELMTEQMIVNIYSKLFRHVSPLFSGTILDVETFTEEQEDASLVYSTISNAVLDILNTLTLEDIRKVLLSYNLTRQYNYQSKPVRFTMNALSDDYARINIVIAALKEEGVYLP